MVLLKGFAFVFVMVLILATSPASADYLSIKYSQKNQLRTGMAWMKLKPRLVLAPRAGGRTTALPDAESGVVAVPDSLATGELPYTSAGKLFFTRENGEIANCSAAFAGAPNLIVTAAHCVMDADGAWNSDFLFIRAYGSSAQDTYAISCVAIPEEWGEIQSDQPGLYDYAFLQAGRQGKGGSLGIANGMPQDALKIIGYADNFYDGRRLIEFSFVAESSQDGRLASLGNQLGRGNSGAPWVSNVSTVYSVSASRRDDISSMWGPRLTDKTLSMIRYVSNGCSES